MLNIKKKYLRQKKSFSPVVWHNNYDNRVSFFFGLDPLKPIHNFNFVEEFLLPS